VIYRMLFRTFRRLCKYEHKRDYYCDMVKKTEQAFGGLAGSVEAILRLFFLSKTL